MASTELCERLGTLGLQHNLVLYVTTKMHFSNLESVKMVSNFVGVVYLAPLLGTFVANVYLSRYPSFYELS
jgi:dipeptide/tripeptide permease